ncbi:CBS domain-containing protein [Rhizobium alvei]|uniref:CBS domain-containing protein n=1 Tax=Rhizobium alvei TaxID=1132659 RepID=A0ABT8YK49_9HYPH|nr:CBS domain-containing protein [Rhizobium alvei]MDO6964050.1 CBS domain-containing protein [Rhizobium alvei]
MRVKAILDQKGRNVLTVGPQVTIRDAARTLKENKIGAVVVLGGGDELVGILSERDIVSAVALHGADCLGKPVSSIMTAKVHQCTEETSIDEVMSMMSERRIRHLPVDKAGRLVGLISIGDVVKTKIQIIQQEADEIKAYIAG